MIVKQIAESIEILNALPKWLLGTVGVFFFSVWLLATYALLTSVGPFHQMPLSEIVYWMFVAIWVGFGIVMFDGMIRVRRFEIRPGLVMKYESRLGAFPFQRSYPSEMVDRIAVRKGGGRGISFSAVLFLNTGKNVPLEIFRTEQEATEFCSRVTDLLQKQTRQ